MSDLKRIDVNLSQSLVARAKALIPNRKFSFWMNKWLRRGVEELEREKEAKS